MKKTTNIHQLLKNKKQGNLYFLVMVAVFLILGVRQFILPQQPPSEAPQQNTNSTTTNQTANVPFTGKNFDVFEKNTKYSATIREIVDGDTFYIEYNKQSFKTRLLIIDAPEIGKQGEPDQPYAQETLTKTKQLIQAANKIEFAFDVGDYTDKYDRALVYLYLDGELLQNKLLEEGLVRVAYKYKPNVTLVPEMEQAQSIAKKAKRNIWSQKGYVTNHGFNPEAFE